MTRTSSNTARQLARRRSAIELLERRLALTTEFFPETVGHITVALPDGGTERIDLTGPTSVEVHTTPDGGANDTDGDGRDQVPTEILSLELHGMSSVGPVALRQFQGQFSPGEIEELVNNTPGILDLPPYTPTGTAESFFDVFFEINVAGQTLHGNEPARMQAILTEQPPAEGETFCTLPNQRPIELLDINGKPTGIRLIDACHTPRPKLDFGDAPDQPYPTLLVSNGARHVIRPGVFLGASVDPERDGQPNLPATGDDIDADGDDEDGVILTSALVAGGVTKVDVIASVNGFLNAWMDFNANGVWEPAEQIFVVQPLVPGLNSLAFEVPAAAVATAPIYSRWRYSTAPLPLRPEGLAFDGEVEDYVHRIEQQTVEVDHFPESIGVIVLQLPNGATEEVHLAGPATAHVLFEGAAEGDADDDDGDGRDEVETELVSMELVGMSSLGLLRVRESPTKASGGAIEELANTMAGRLDLPPFAPTGKADSFFDVFFDIEVAGQMFHGALPAHLTATISHKPPRPGEMYFGSPTGQPIQLLDANGNPTGLLLRAEKLTPVPLCGDTNNDGDVDIADLNNVRNNFGVVQPGQGPVAGDTTPFDGRVNINDLNAVRNCFGNSAVPTPNPLRSPQSAALPRADDATVGGTESRAGLVRPLAPLADALFRNWGSSQARSSRRMLLTDGEDWRPLSAVAAQLAPHRVAAYGSSSSHEAIAPTQFTSLKYVPSTVRLAPTASPGADRDNAETNAAFELLDRESLTATVQTEVVPRMVVLRQFNLGGDVESGLGEPR